MSFSTDTGNGSIILVSLELNIPDSTPKVVVERIYCIVTTSSTCTLVTVGVPFWKRRNGTRVDLGTPSSKTSHLVMTKTLLC